MTTTDQPTPQGSPRQPIDPTGTATPPPPPPGYVPAVYVQQPSGGKAAIKVVLYVAVVALLMSITINVYLSKYGPVALFLNSLAQSGPQERSYYPAVEPTENTNRVVVVEITGTIDGDTANFARDTFFTLEQDPPGAVILRVESGGGGVTASDQIWHAVTSFMQKHPDVPVISSFGVAAASGGYYISAPTDYIFCEKSSVTGSIGVYAQIPGFGGLVEMMGVEMNMIIAEGSPNKGDANNLFINWYDDEGNLTDEGQASYDVVRNLVDVSYVTFRDIVVQGRSAADSTITEEALADAMTGSIFIGQEAVDAKLVDEIGYIDDAIAHAVDKAGIDTQDEDFVVTVLRQQAPGLFSRAAGSRQGIDLTDVTGEELNNFVDDAMAVRLQYRMRIR